MHIHRFNLTATSEETKTRFMAEIPKIQTLQTKKIVIISFCACQMIKL